MKLKTRKARDEWGYSFITKINIYQTVSSYRGIAQRQPKWWYSIQRWDWDQDAPGSVGLCRIASRCDCRSSFVVFPVVVAVVGIIRSAKGGELIIPCIASVPAQGGDFHTKVMGINFNVNCRFWRRSATSFSCVDRNEEKQGHYSNQPACQWLSKTTVRGRNVFCSNHF